MHFLNKAQAQAELTRWVQAHPPQLQAWIVKRAFPVFIEAGAKRYVKQKSLLATPIRDRYGNLQTRNTFSSAENPSDRVVLFDKGSANVSVGELVGEADITLLPTQLHGLTPVLDFLRARFGEGDVSRIVKMPYTEAVNQSEEWHKQEELRRQREEEKERIRRIKLVNEGAGAHYLVDASFLHQGDWYTCRSYISREGLAYEGDTLHHCVACFWQDVVSKAMRIVGFAKNNEPLLTIAFSAEAKYVIQNRGLQNRLPTADEERLLKPVLGLVYQAANQEYLSEDLEADVRAMNFGAFSHDPKNWERWSDAISQVL